MENLEYIIWNRVCLVDLGAFFVIRFSLLGLFGKRKENKVLWNAAEFACGVFGFKRMLEFLSSSFFLTTFGIGLFLWHPSGFLLMVFLGVVPLGSTKGLEGFVVLSRAGCVLCVLSFLCIFVPYCNFSSL